MKDSVLDSSLACVFLKEENTKTLASCETPSTCALEYFDGKINHNRGEVMPAYNVQGTVYHKRNKTKREGNRRTR